MAFPKTYRPRFPVPGDEGPRAAHFAEELRALQETLEGVLYLLPQRSIAAPARPREGMIRYSMTPWWPVAGQAADRWVIYCEDTNVWNYLD